MQVLAPTLRLLRFGHSIPQAPRAWPDTSDNWAQSWRLRSFSRPLWADVRKRGNVKKSCAIKLMIRRVSTLSVSLGLGGFPSLADPLRQRDCPRAPSGGSLSERYVWPYPQPRSYGQTERSRLPLPAALSILTKLLAGEDGGGPRRSLRRPRGRRS